MSKLEEKLAEGKRETAVKFSLIGGRYREYIV
jgi:hypothetical protein